MSLFFDILSVVGSIIAVGAGFVAYKEYATRQELYNRSYTSLSKL